MSFEICGRLVNRKELEDGNHSFPRWPLHSNKMDRDSFIRLWLIHDSPLLFNGGAGFVSDCANYHSWGQIEVSLSTVTPTIYIIYNIVQDREHLDWKGFARQSDFEVISDSYSIPTPTQSTRLPCPFPWSHSFWVATITSTVDPCQEGPICQLQVNIWSPVGMASTVGLTLQQSAGRVTEGTGSIQYYTTAYQVLSTLFQRGFQLWNRWLVRFWTYDLANQQMFCACVTRQALLSQEVDDRCKKERMSLRDSFEWAYSHTIILQFIVSVVGWEIL